MPVISPSQQSDWDSNAYVVWTIRALVIVGVTYLGRSSYQLWQRFRTANGTGSTQGRPPVLPSPALNHLTNALSAPAASVEGSNEIGLEAVVADIVDGVTTENEAGLPDVHVTVDSSLRPPPRRYDPHERVDAPHIRDERRNQRPDDSSTSATPKSARAQADGSNLADERIVIRDRAQTPLNVVG